MFTSSGKDRSKNKPYEKSNGPTFLPDEYSTGFFTLTSMAIFYADRKFIIPKVQMPMERYINKKSDELFNCTEK